MTDGVERPPATDDPPSALELLVVGLVAALFARARTVPLTPREEDFIDEAIALIPNFGEALDLMPTQTRPD